MDSDNVTGCPDGSLIYDIAFQEAAGRTPKHSSHSLVSRQPNSTTCASRLRSWALSGVERISGWVRADIVCLIPSRMGAVGATCSSTTYFQIQPLHHLLSASRAQSALPNRRGQCSTQRLGRWNTQDIDQVTAAVLYSFLFDECSLFSRHPHYAASQTGARSPGRVLPQRGKSLVLSLLSQHT